MPHCCFSPMLLIYAESTATFVANAVTRDDFPPGFIFGAGTSAYQVEGAAAEDGRKPSIWDTFAHAGKNLDKSTADIAADQYHKYKEDVKLMHEIGLNAYRFSISWSRLIPDGRGPVNPKGLEYYNNLINELISYNIEAHVTLHHFDLPQALQDEYEGFLSQRIVEDFTAYADTCFREFGNRVTNWITFNEPNVEPISGYSLGVFPPGRCSYPCGNCYMGDSAREPYVVGHNFLLSHASAAALYKEKYQLMQEGKVGITLMGLWFEPLTNLPGDVAAAKRTEEFILGWFLHPLVYGTYPAHMKEVLGSRLPSFGAEESKFLKASFDFIGITHYNAMYQGEYNTSSTDLRNCLADIYAKLSTSKVQFGKNIFEQVQEFPDLSIITPWSLKKLLEYIKEKYGNPPLIIHEMDTGSSM
ncbi:beta-glucosidase 31-like isoform X1 [Iris pallida]|uniref:Beta-glucosidase 31-like isoform X1 n=1 Tax=Iris pallida TaxID=29817 RepID=A0AAX6EJ63_IRIPA|nr:beta-glucosidase 31-like isoform X1 [Iris pallida]